ncbi:prenyltransferase/squalene oxidase repeat-containing protein [Alkalihalobacillus sp. AL-G]|uniref:terpene cyclase/mutase family protein n=1 Tax=Alkalihalobacillus sp. AL-G TaxID=2926399 RepID=UPI0027298129|nr:prenyltransferase/squalene oxidase repeat-containing protein [Alkalihalobacillus sp. AL-G]WLD91686.1 squalene--hopene cyclase [Alkalihalobacillus sp. AL-G]
MREAVESEINRIISILVEDQTSDGSWDYAFDTGIATDAYMIILLRTLELNDELLIQALVKRILSKQEQNGAWKLFHDEDSGNLSATVEAYYALLYSGYRIADEKEMVAARKFILSMGGIEKTGMFTKILLSLTGQLPWQSNFPFPIEIILFPISYSINFYDFSVFGRANLAPILILYDRKYQKKTKQSPDLSDLVVNRGAFQQENYEESEEWRSFYSSMKVQLQKQTNNPKNAHGIAMERSKQYMLNHIEADGTLYSYFSATFLMIFAFLSIGYTKDHPVITKAIKGLKSMACQIDDHIHMQYTTADVWNTSLISHALQDAGVPFSSQVVQRANNYLLSRQQFKFGDWAIHNPNTLPGGWGFSNINTINPDVDDTTMSLRSIRNLVKSHSFYQQAWYRGVNWALSMQNDDGGWPAFERNVDNKLLSFAPIQGAEYLLLDPSSADLTGRTLEFFRNYTHINNEHPAVKKGLKWLIDDQKPDGSWYGRWGICYIYGTWAALAGMSACGKSIADPVVKKAMVWLKMIQNEDGGWGESCKSDINKKYVPLGESTLTHTAWAVDAMILMSNEITPEIRRGIEYLIRSGDKQDWTTAYPKGQGMAGGFYIHYHSYRYIWPLLALSHFKEKF